MNDSELEPFSNATVQLIPQSVRDLELLDVDGISVSQFDVVEEGFGPPQIFFVSADSRVMLQDHVKVLFPEFLWDKREVGILPNELLFLGCQLFTVFLQVFHQLRPLELCHVGRTCRPLLIKEGSELINYGRVSK